MALSNVQFTFYMDFQSSGIVEGACNSSNVRFPDCEPSRKIREGGSADKISANCSGLWISVYKSKVDSIDVNIPFSML